jgi:hypothetical protein
MRYTQTKDGNPYNLNFGRKKTKKLKNSDM